MARKRLKLTVTSVNEPDPELVAEAFFRIFRPEIEEWLSDIAAGYEPQAALRRARMRLRARSKDRSDR